MGFWAKSGSGWMEWITLKLLLSPCRVLLGLLRHILTGGTFPLSCYSQEQMAVVFWGLFVHQVIPIPCILSKSSQLASFKCIIITWPWCTIVLFSLNLPFPKLVKKHKWSFPISYFWPPKFAQIVADDVEGPISFCCIYLVANWDVPWRNVLWSEIIFRSRTISHHF